MSYAASEGGRDRQSARAALFVDYDNIYHTLGEDPHGREKSENLISEMLEALKQSLSEERGVQTAVARAYADFTDLDGQGDVVQRMLYLQDVESRYVPGSLQSTTVEVQLCVDAMEVLHHREDIDTFVLLTGRRTYLPLVQHCKRYGRRVLVAALDEPGSLDRPHDADGVWFFDARDLLSSTVRVARGQAPVTGVGGSNGSPTPGTAGSRRIVDDPLLIQAIEIIDEHFGQYDEVYLTPLLRKMSEILDERTCDPKALVSALEDHHAVRLEKRQGFPHDYTVLIVNTNHPDVERLQRKFRDEDPFYRDDMGSSYDGRAGAVDDASADGKNEFQDRLNYAFDGDDPSEHDFDDDFDAVSDDDEFEGDNYEDPSREG